MKTFFMIVRASLVFTVGAFLLCGAAAQAQEETSPVRYGLTMGLNMGKFVWPDGTWAADRFDDRLMQPAMRYGWVAEFFTANDAISIVTGIDYRMTREKYHITPPTNPITPNDPGLWMDRMGNYLTVPVLFKYAMNPVKGVLPFFEFGPQAAFLLSFTGKEDAPGRSARADPGPAMEMTQYTRRVTMELRGGAGIEYPMGKMFTGVIEAGYEYGLTSIVTLEGFKPTTARNLFFTMGIRF
jgi:hypothetical protein